MTDAPPVFVIGDCHGHIDRLEELLIKAKVNDLECVVVQLGDLGHFGAETGAGDREAWYRAAKEHWLDVVLWGNHDRAVVDRTHQFGGYRPPEPEVMHLMRLMEYDGRVKFAMEAHGWLLTHGGLHPDYVPKDLDGDAAGLADWLNQAGQAPVIDAVGKLRGGEAEAGGILWRDIREDIYDGVPQVFGHSANPDHLVQGEADKWYCIDIGGKGGRADPDANCLAGMWLPSQELVRVDLNQRSTL